MSKKLINDFTKNEILLNKLYEFHIFTNIY